MQCRRIYRCLNPILCCLRMSDLTKRSSKVGTMLVRCCFGHYLVQGGWFVSSNTRLVSESVGISLEMRTDDCSTQKWISAVRSHVICRLSSMCAARVDTSSTHWNCAVTYACPSSCCYTAHGRGRTRGCLRQQYPLKVLILTYALPRTTWWEVCDFAFCGCAWFWSPGCLYVRPIPGDMRKSSMNRPKSNICTE